MLQPTNLPFLVPFGPTTLHPVNRISLTAFLSLDLKQLGSLLVQSFLLSQPKLNNLGSPLEHAFGPTPSSPLSLNLTALIPFWNMPLDPILSPPLDSNLTTLDTFQIPHPTSCQLSITTLVQIPSRFPFPFPTSCQPSITTIVQFSNNLASSGPIALVSFPNSLCISLPVKTLQLPSNHLLHSLIMFQNSICLDLNAHRSHSQHSNSNNRQQALTQGYLGSECRTCSSSPEPLQRAFNQCTTGHSLINAFESYTSRRQIVYALMCMFSIKFYKIQMH